MTQDQIYQNIAQRTGGDIYLGVVGPVRSGKSTFIKRFAELMLLPRIKNEARRARAHDELPQSAAGRTIMTTEPNFIFLHISFIIVVFCCRIWGFTPILPPFSRFTPFSHY